MNREESFLRKKGLLALTPALSPRERENFPPIQVNSTLPLSSAEKQIRNYFGNL